MIRFSPALISSIQKQFEGAGIALPEDRAEVVAAVASAVLKKPMDNQYAEIAEWNLTLIGLPDRKVLVTHYGDGLFGQVARIDFAETTKLCRVGNL